MSEPLFNRSKAVADLNRVDGFDPMELARVIQNDGQEPQLYLDVKFRKLWFRLCNPKGKISKKILSLQENMAVVEAKIYLDKDDPEEGYIASALAQKFRTDDPQFGNKFLETAETAATGRALADAGYGIQFVESEENDPNQVDAGIPLPQGYPGNGQAVPMPNMPGPMPYANGAGNPGAEARGNSQREPNMPMLDPRASVAELLRSLDFEQAKAVVIPGNGVNSGKTMGQLAIENPASLEWYIKSYKGPNNLLRAAAQVLLQQAA